MLKKDSKKDGRQGKDMRPWVRLGGGKVICGHFLPWANGLHRNGNEYRQQDYSHGMKVTGCCKLKDTSIGQELLQKSLHFSLFNTPQCFCTLKSTRGIFLLLFFCSVSLPFSSPPPSFSSASIVGCSSEMLSLDFSAVSSCVLGVVQERSLKNHVEFRARSRGTL